MFVENHAEKSLELMFKIWPETMLIVSSFILRNNLVRSSYVACCTKHT
jgi:hypothetical protein